ncbi:hypothetical protein EBB07_14960 [Paenibacillaceae bacterium]|nr:hypothetical protein EBB07_14960 [Paenibacillaceae bacterium]
MKKIGFIDFYIDEWHANNYPAWIRERAAASGLDWDVAYAWAETDKPGGIDTDSWCAAHQVERVASIEELVEKSDAIIVLSPDHPEHHERLAQLPLQSGKPVYMDKTFSPDLATGIRLFKQAHASATPLFSSSALRFAKEWAELPDEVNQETIAHLAVSGPGQYANYAVHQFEMIVTLMGAGAQRIKSLSTEHARQLIVEYGDGRQASMLQMEHAPFQAVVQLKQADGAFVPACSDIFVRLIDAVLDFFETGKPPVPQEETLAIMALIDAGAEALRNRDAWIQVKQA